LLGLKLQSCFNKPRGADKQVADTINPIVPQAIPCSAAVIETVLEQLVPALCPSMVK